VRVILRTNRTVDIKVHVSDIGSGTVGGVVNTQRVPVIAIIHRYALLGKFASIHSPSQLKWYKNEVNDNLEHVPGVFNGLLTWMATSFLLSLKTVWHVSTFGHIQIMSKKLSSLPLNLSGTPLFLTMNSLMNHNGEITVPQ
jgi:hypothetical protein